LSGSGKLMLAMSATYSSRVRPAMRGFCWRSEPMVVQVFPR
jgi:hypothetical protein